MTATETVAICITTVGRHQLLVDALRASVAAEAPPGCHVEIIVIDNDAAQSARRAVEGFAVASARPVIYETEARRGVVDARNRAIDVARARGARWLAFVDDDAEPDVKWLSLLVEALRGDRAQLAGGANLLKPPKEPLTAWQSYLCRGMIAHAERRASGNARSAARGEGVTITTGNWCADLDWLAAKGLRFDPRFNASGGEDTAFYRALRASDAKAVYVARSLMVETIPASRLSLRYQFRRRLNSGITKGRQYRETRGLASAMARSLGQVLLASLAVAPLLLLAGVLTPFHRSGSAQALVGLSRMMGRTIGLVGGAVGFRSEEYGERGYANAIAEDQQRGGANGPPRL